MIDESTHMDVNGHIVVFAYFIEDGLLVLVFVRLIQIEDRKKDFKEIYKVLLRAMKK